MRDIEWVDDCAQESAGWCYGWGTKFAVVWEIQNGESVESMKANMIQNILPKVLDETFHRYAQFVARVVSIPTADASESSAAHISLE